MTWLQFIAAVTGSLSWPLMVVIVLLAFRRPIIERVASIHKISHGGTEVLFDQKAREVQSAIAAASEPIDDGSMMMRELPRNVARIVLAWQELENALMQRLAAKGVDTSRVSGGNLVDLAHREDAITEEQFNALTGLRSMRNLAAHRQEGDINAGRLAEFVVLADAMLAVLKMTK